MNKLNISHRRMILIVFAAFFISDISGQIVIDGLFDDWSTATTTQVGTNGTASLEVTDMGGQLCLHISGTDLTLTHDTYLDSDCDATIGYNGGNVWDVDGQGADFLLQGAFAYSSAFDVSNGATWSWNFDGGISFNPNSYDPGLITDIEYCFDLPPACGTVSIGACINDAGSQFCVPAEDPAGDYFSYLLIDANLPIELISFQAEKLDSRSNILTWKTATEINNELFKIERSTNGREWMTIANVEGVGTSFTTQSYQWIDIDVKNQNYYRLKQIDFDGKYSYSPIVKIDNPKSQISSIFPNPTNGLTTISFSENYDLNTEEINLFNHLGINVKANVGFSFKSKSKLNLDLSNLLNGIYFLSVNNQIHQIVVLN